jgi:hypothetical protein
MKPAPPLLVKLLLVVTSRYSIVVINALLLLISALSLLEMLPLLYNSTDNLKEIEDILECLGVILIGYGVAIEERQAFMRIFRLYPAHDDPIQRLIDHHCHEYGLCYLLLGLFMEICVAVVKIPNRVINTENLEAIIFCAGIVFVAWNAALMSRHCWFLLRPSVENAEQ